MSSEKLFSGLGHYPIPLYPNYSNTQLIQRLLSTVIELNERVEKLEKNSIKWTILNEVASLKGLTKDAVRKQLQNGDFEEDVDFKYDGNKIMVHQGAIGRIRRQRRSKNG